jgi:hypothetical protein
MPEGDGQRAEPRGVMSTWLLSWAMGWATVTAAFTAFYPYQIAASVPLGYFPPSTARPRHEWTKWDVMVYLVRAGRTSEL